MGLQLPEEVREFLYVLGFLYPAPDETGLTDLGQQCAGACGPLDGQIERATSSVAPTWTHNNSLYSDGLRMAWESEASPAVRLAGGVTGLEIIAAGLLVCAGIVLVLKLAVIAQVTATLIAVATAVAAAVATGGISAAAVIVLREACRRVLDFLLGEAIARVLNG